MIPEPVIFAELFHLMSPRVPELRKAMKKQHQWLVLRPIHDTVQLQATFLNRDKTKDELRRLQGLFEAARDRGA